MEIRQGDIYWIEQEEAEGSEPGYRRPFLVIQNNLFNQSRINTVIVCALTTNLQRAKAPGNVLLEPDEGGISKASVINVSQVFTVDKSELDEYCGSISQRKLMSVINGLQMVILPADIN
jgi:mRNA interferase MazF